jgi:hypothetical protein
LFDFIKENPLPEEVKKLRKLMMLTAMLGLVAAYMVPAAAQEVPAAAQGGGGTDNNCPAFIINPAQEGSSSNAVLTDSPFTPTCTDIHNTTPNQEFDQNHDSSGAVTNNNDIHINGDGNTVNSSPQQNGYSGNVFNQQGNEPTDSTQEDVDFSGSTSENNPSETVGS